MIKRVPAAAVAVLTLSLGVALGPGSAAAAGPKGRGGPKVAVVSSDYGRILANGRGRALYLFTSDTGPSSTCYDACAIAWPPYIVRSKPRAVGGAKRGLVGTTRRSDGRLQATYAGHPVYYYVGDSAPGEVLCQAVFEYGGYWYVLRAGGEAVR